MAALAAKRGITTNARGEISNNAAFGTIESAETIAFFVTLVTWPASLAALAWILATLCVVTTVACVGVDAMVVKARPTS